MERVALVGWLVLPLLGFALLGNATATQADHEQAAIAKAEPDKRLQWWQSAL